MSTSFPITTSLLLLICCAQLHRIVSSKECIDVSSPNTRIFTTLKEFQANNVSFNPQAGGFQGNYVSITEPLEELEKNSFVSFGSNFIVKLILNSRHLRNIDADAFFSLDCLKVLDLKQNQLGLLFRNMFQGLKDLHNLILSQNSIREVPERVFYYTPNLRKLNLSRNSLSVLHPESFYNLSFLEELDMSRNKLYAFTPDTFQYFVRLVNLQLSSNQFDVLEFEKWHTPKLQVLNLAGNSLESFDTTYKFSFNSTLTELYLNDNLLIQLNEVGLRRNLPRLKRVDLNGNPWLCARLALIVKVLNDSRVAYDGLADGDPQVGGIACNRSMDSYVKKKTMEQSTQASHVVFSTAAAGSQQKGLVDLTSPELVDLFRNINYYVTGTFVLVFMYIVVDFVVRARLLQFVLSIFMKGARNETVLDNSSVENLGLLQDRFL